MNITYLKRIQKVVSILSQFVVNFSWQLIAVTFIVYIIFLVSPGVHDQLLFSLSQSNSTKSLFGYLYVFFNWFKSIMFSLDFGALHSTGENMTVMLLESAMNSLVLVGGALVITFLLGNLIVYVKINYSHSLAAKNIIFGMLVLSSIHYIILCYFLMAEMGYNTLRDTWSIFPFLVLGVGSGVLNEMVDMLDAEVRQIVHAKYILAARARGASILRNAAKPMCISLLQILNAKFPLLLSGAFIIEWILNIHGIGYLTIEKAIRGEDYNLLLSITFLITFIVLFVNQATDYIQRLLDPRPLRVY